MTRGSLTESLLARAISGPAGESAELEASRGKQRGSNLATSDAGRSALDGWRRGSLLLFALAATGLIAIIVSRSAVIAIAAMAIIAVVSLGVHLASRRPSVASGAARSLPAEDLASIPEAARNILEFIDEPLLVLDRTG